MLFFGQGCMTPSGPFRRSRYPQDATTYARRDGSFVATHTADAEQTPFRSTSKRGLRLFSPRTFHTTRSHRKEKKNGTLSVDKQGQIVHRASPEGSSFPAQPERKREAARTVNTGLAKQDPNERRRLLSRSMPKRQHRPRDALATMLALLSSAALASRSDAPKRISALQGDRHGGFRRPSFLRS